ncbi:hypothetical protein ABK046_51705, partial [Streptomyces caeruleatus]
MQKFDSKGSYLAKWGTFSYPADVAVDPQGYMYVVDYHLNTVQKFDPDGQFQLSWGSLGSAAGE